MKKVSVCILALGLPILMCACGKGNAACLECADKGLDECAGHKCLACDGRGVYECYACGGNDVYGICYFCDGGYADCPCEDGLIYFNTPYTGEGEGSEGGGSTGGSTGSACNKCDDGYVECSLCDGSGRFGSYSVGGFDGADSTEVDKLCMTCRGLGKTECTYCGGDGMN